MEKTKEFNESEFTHENSFTCPNCHSDETDPDPDDTPDASLYMIDFETVSRSYVCLECGSKWEALFSYQGYKRTVKS